jgi:hypothetical protein
MMAGCRLLRRRTIGTGPGRIAGSCDPRSRRATGTVGGSPSRRGSAPAHLARRAVGTGAAPRLEVFEGGSCIEHQFARMRQALSTVLGRSVLS